MLCVSSLDEHLFEAVKAGAIGYVTRMFERCATSAGSGKGGAALAGDDRQDLEASAPKKVKAADRENSITKREAEILGFWPRAPRPGGSPSNSASPNTVKTCAEHSPQTASITGPRRPRLGRQPGPGRIKNIWTFSIPAFCFERRRH